VSQLYSNLKFLRYADHIAALHDQRVVAPVHIRIKPMNHCNHDCWYCAYRVSNLQLGEDIDYKDTIPKAKMFEIVEDVIAMGVKAVTFSGGGEPLLYKPLPEVVKRLAEGGVRVATLTNGSNLKGRVADAFAEYGTWVRCPPMRGMMRVSQNRAALRKGSSPSCWRTLAVFRRADQNACWG